MPNGTKSRIIVTAIIIVYFEVWYSCILSIENSKCDKNDSNDLCDIIFTVK